MPNANARNRMVVFRLTHEEYSTLRSICTSRGGRNLSEFTRNEILNAVGAQNAAEIIDRRLQALEDQILPLRLTLAKLTNLLAEALSTSAARRSSTNSEPAPSPLE